jgi:protein-S-isoprenylcysteine O-methyltransferase Ste14
MYVALALVLAGIAWWVGTAAATAVPFLFLLHVRLFNVPLEEARLERLFGDAYDAYRARVRRWV